MKMKSDFSRFPSIEFECHAGDLKNVIIPKPKQKPIQTPKTMSIVEEISVPISINIVNNVTLGKRDVPEIIEKVLEKSANSFASSELKKKKLE